MDSHDLHIDLTPIALILTVALICGIVLTRLRQPSIVGYIAAGIVLGPTGLSLVQNSMAVKTLAEMGVLLLLFLIGMELSLRAFVKVFKVASLTALFQILASLFFTLLLSVFFDWSFGESVFYAMVFALSSTAVAIKILENTGDLRNEVGRLTIGVLIAQDLAIVPMLLTISVIGGEQEMSFWVLIKIALAIAVLGWLIYILSRRERLKIPLGEWLSGKTDILPLAALAFCFGLSTLSGLVGITAAYGAFIAGLIIGNSSARVAIHRVTEPIQAVLLAVFFLSIGLLIDLNYIAENWFSVSVGLILILTIKTIVNIAILHFLGQSWDKAFLSGVVMGQVGEFSFVLLAAGFAAKLVDIGSYKYIIAIIALSLVFSPLWQIVTNRIHDYMNSKRAKKAPEDWRPLVQTMFIGDIPRKSTKRKPSASRKKSKAHAEKEQDID